MQRLFTENSTDTLPKAKQIQAAIKNKKNKVKYSSLSVTFSLKDTAIVYIILLAFQNKFCHGNERLKDSFKLRT